MTTAQAKDYIVKTALDSAIQFHSEGLEMSDEVCFDIASCIIDSDGKVSEALKVLDIEEGYDSQLYIAEWMV